MKKQMFVSESLKDAGKRAAKVWERASRGEKIETQDNVTFVSWNSLVKVMTDKRQELLRHLHKRPAPSTLALARDLGRDYKRVHEDVAALESIGLVERKGRQLRAEYDVIKAEIVM